MFSSTVDEYWFGTIARPDVPGPVGALRVAVDPALPRDRRVMVLELPDTGGLVTVGRAEATALGLEHGREVSTHALQRALDRASITLNGADALCYFSSDEKARLRREERPGFVRQLTQADAGLFAGLVAAAPADDLDEAFVELDHWLVFGAVIEDRLVCAASMYPWGGTTLADLGVITLPEHRGRGVARAVVRAIGAHAIALGHEPQYRCRLDNVPSLALAASAGLERFGTWDVVRDES